LGNNVGRGSNFVQGGPSGTAGSGSGGNSGHDTENHDNIFADGVFRVAHGRPNNGAGGYRNNQGFNRYNERRNFGGNGEKFRYNERRYTGYPNGRNVNPRQNDTADGLTVIQFQLVKEAAEALARQFVERQPDPVRSSDAPMQSAESQPMGLVAHAQPTGQMLQGRTSSEQRAVSSLLAVAGIGQGSKNMDVPSAVDTLAKKKSPNCYRCHKNGHCLNECEVVLCNCC
jgi:hypothetical protein